MEIKSKNLPVLLGINNVIKTLINNDTISNDDIHDGYHSFGELYEIRKVYNACLFNQWAKMAVGFPIGYEQLSKEDKLNPDKISKLSKKVLYDVHKSMKHNDGELCFGGGWFIVIAILPTGQISNHYRIEDWDLFQIPETDIAKYPFDGHTTNNVIDRLKSLCNG